MTLTRRMTALAVAPVLALALTACGSDDGGGAEASSEEQPYVDAVMASFDEEEDMPFSESEAECVATLMVQAVGVDRFEDAGVAPEDIDGDWEPGDAGIELSAEEEQAIAEDLPDCLDLVALFAESMAEDESLSDEDRQCIEDNLEEDQIAGLIAAEIAGEEPGEEAMTWVFELMAACPGLAGDMSGE